MTMRRGVWITSDNDDVTYKRPLQISTRKWNKGDQCSFWKLLPSIVVLNSIQINNIWIWHCQRPQFWKQHTLGNVNPIWSTSINIHLWMLWHLSFDNILKCCFAMFWFYLPISYTSFFQRESHLLGILKMIEPVGQLLIRVDKDRNQFR